MFYDIDNKVGVSISVVSRALNNSGYVKKEKRKEILKVAEELGYHPNPVAMSLQQRRTKQILYYSTDLNNFFNIELYKGMIDGIILPNDYITAEYLKAVGNNYHLPVVTASYGDDYYFSKAVPKVQTDLYQGMQDALQYLWDRGHRKISMISSYDFRANHGRTKAWSNFMQYELGDTLEDYYFGISKEGLHNDERVMQFLEERLTDTIDVWESYYEKGELAAEVFHERQNGATAVIGFNDEMALGFCRRIQELGYKVPEDISLMGIVLAMGIVATSVVGCGSGGKKSETLTQEDAQNIMADDFVQFKWDQAISSDGERLVAIPWDLGPTLYYYRTDVFKEVGLPTDPNEVAELMSTWDGVLEVAEKVSIPGERWFLPSAAFPYQWMFINRDYYDEDLNLKLEREGDLECLQACLDIRQGGWDMNVDMWSGEAYAAYEAGTCVTVAAGSWFSGFLKTDIDPNGAGNWGATVLPGGMPATNWGGSFLVIPEQSKNKEAAWAFVKYMLATSEGQNDMFEAVDYFPAYIPAWEAAPDLYTAPDAYFGGQSPNAIATEIAAQVETVYNTIMDTTAEGYLYTSFNAGAEAGETPEQIRSRLGKDIQEATVELKEQQIQTLKDAGVWK